METGSGSVRFATREDIAYITLDAPPMNILTKAMMDAIGAALERAAADTSLKGVTFTAEGKAFSAGADVGEHHPDRAPEMIASFTRMLRGLEAMQVPVVMAVDGPALGGGFELAIMADVLLATEGATFGQPEIRLGFFAPLGVVRLPELVGTAKAVEITCSGRTYSAEEMYRYGIVTRLVPRDELDGVMEEVLGDFRRASPAVMRLNVRTLKRLRGRPFDEALGEAGKVFLEELMRLEDPIEGITSFYEKRRPEWKNR